MADIDVVIVTYRSAQHLADCVESVPAGHRVIVVDNASNDGSADIAEALGCEVIRNDTNDGFGRAVNKAVRERVTAPFVLLLNPDARLTPRCIDALRAQMDDPAVAVAGARLRNDDDGGEQRPWWEFPSASLAWREAFGLHRLRPPDFTRDRDVDFVVGAVFLVRTHAFHAMRGFDERYWLYGEEADLCRRLNSAGWRIRYVADAWADHVGGASGEGASDLVGEHFRRGYERFVFTHDGTGALVSFRVANIVASLLRIPRLAHDDPRRAVRVQNLRRSIGALVRHPTLVSRPDRHCTTRSIVVCSLEAWDDVWRRNQFLVRELTDADPDLRVLFVEPPIDVLHTLRTERRLPLAALRAIRPRPLPGRPQVMRLTPRKWLPRRLGPWADRHLARQVIRAVAQAEMAEPTLWLNSLGFTGLLERTSWPVLYDVTDDWLRADVDDHERRVRADREARVLSLAGQVVVCSPDLAASKGATRDVVLVPNAVDVDHVRRPRPRPADLPLAAAVYVGTLHDDRIDIRLLERCAFDNPTVPIVLVGPDALSADSRARLDRHPNIHRLGPRPYDDVPAYLQHASVVIVPHVVSEFTESLDPIKAYECLAAGRPTVATPVAGFRDLGDPVVIAEREVFVKLVGELADEQRATVTTADLPSWAERAASFDSALRAASDPVVARFDPPLRVVYLDHIAKLSGGELALVRLLPALVELGVAPHVVLGEDGPLVAELEAAGATVEVLPMADDARDLRRDRVAPRRLPLGSVVSAARYTWQVRRRLRELRPDLVHTNSLKAALYGGFAARLARVPVIWHVRDRIADDYLPRPAVRLIRFLARHVPDAVIANSQATLDTVGMLEHPMSVIPSPVVFDSAAPHPRAVESAHEVFTVGMIGRLAPWKGQHVFLDAFAQAFPERGARALIVGSAMFGEDDYEALLHAQCVRLGIEDRVTFTGFRRNVDVLLAEMDVLVHASTVPEPFGQVVVEGMAAGVPVIATNAGGPAEIITDGVDGVLVPPGDAAELAAAMRTLRDGTAVRASLRAAGLDRAADFTPSVTASSVARLYRRARPGTVAAAGR